MDVKVIQEIKEIQQMLQLKFNLRMEWVDARLEFYNIKLDETMNVITTEELERIWLPIRVVDNTENDRVSRSVEQKTFPGMTTTVRSTTMAGQLKWASRIQDVVAQL